jgi:hypothetical protein
MHEQEFSSGSNDGNGGVGGDEPPSKKPKAKAKAKVKAKTEPEVQPEEITPVKQLTTLMVNAFKLKVRIQKSQSEGKLFKELIMTNSKWEWGKCSLYLGRLTEALAKLGSVNEFAEAVMYSDQKELRAKYGAEYLIVNLTTFVGMTEDVEQLEKVNSCIATMKKASERG